MLGIADGAKQLASIDISDLKSGTIEINDACNQFAPDFGPLFDSLVDVITAQERKQRAKQAASQQSSTPMSSGSTITIGKRSPSEFRFHRPYKKDKANK